MATMEAGTVPRVVHPVVPALTPRLLRLASDARLVGLVREGREGAFEAVYDRHHRGILAFCRHMLGDADEAEDAVQHTFMAAYTDMLTSEKPIHLRAWLFTIARNRCYSILRARREQPSAEIEEKADDGLASQVQRRQDLRDLVADMRKLPDEQRAALVLAELDSLSHAEIAEVLDIPREKVKALVFQARESLMASRTARDTACSEIREQLACGRGASLRRANLRRHLRECDGCRAYSIQVKRQRKQFALVLPIVPGLALKEAVLGATVGGSSAAVGGGLIASGALKSGIAKGLIGALLAGAGTAGTLVVAGTNLHFKQILAAISDSLSKVSSGGRQLGGHSTRAVATNVGTTTTAAAAAQLGIRLAPGGAHLRIGAIGAGSAALGSTSATRLHHRRPARMRLTSTRGAHRLHAVTIDGGPTTAAPAAAPVLTPAPVTPAPVVTAPLTIRGYAPGSSSSGGGSRGNGNGVAAGNPHGASGTAGGGSTGAGRDPGGFAAGAGNGNGNGSSRGNSGGSGGAGSSDASGSSSGSSNASGSTGSVRGGGPPSPAGSDTSSGATGTPTGSNSASSGPATGTSGTDSSGGAGGPGPGRALADASATPTP
jgi:RNA polymerase sigma factor (sigma-70 family)